MFYFIISVAFFIALLILKDHLIYKLKGSAQHGDLKESNHPVITGPEDALAQRLLDLQQKEEVKAPSEYK